MEECAQCTLGAYASGMAMAFAANLLVTAWASFYRLLQNRQRELATEAEGLARNPLIEEEVGIEILQEQISRWRRYRGGGHLERLASVRFLTLPRDR